MYYKIYIFISLKEINLYYSTRAFSSTCNCCISYATKHVYFNFDIIIKNLNHYYSRLYYNQYRERRRISLSILDTHYVNDIVDDINSRNVRYALCANVAGISNFSLKIRDIFSFEEIPYLDILL